MIKERLPCVFSRIETTSVQEIVGQNFISGYLEACFQQERIIRFQQLDAVTFEFLEDCSNSFGIPSEEINANIWELARNMSVFYFFFMEVSRGKNYPAKKGTLT